MSAAPKVQDVQRRTIIASQLRTISGALEVLSAIELETQVRQPAADVIDQSRYVLDEEKGAAARLLLSRALRSLDQLVLIQEQLATLAQAFETDGEVPA